MVTTIAELVEKDRVATVITQLFVSTDAKDWPKVRECFQSSVLFDMTSMAAGEPATLTPNQITDTWDAGLRPIESVHHQTGNLVVWPYGEEAKAFCYGTAWHYRRTRSGRNTRVFVGSYDFELGRGADEFWRIKLFRFNLKFIDGNRELETEPGA
jgi:hypothetical protein